MADPSTISLAIETSSRRGSIAVGRGGDMLEAVDLPEARRHDVMLTPAIAALFKRHGLSAADLDEVYISVGPGSFTGLRVGVATVKALALALSARIVAVATLDVLAAAAPPPPPDRPRQRLAIGLNLKKGTLYSGVFAREAEDGGAAGWRPITEPAVRTFDDLLSNAGRPLAILADPLPPEADALPPDVHRLDAALAIPRASTLWSIGHRLAREGRFTDPAALTPLYARPPEAVQLWQQRRARAAEGPSQGS